MELQKLLDLLKNIKKGTFIHLEYKSEPKPLASHKGDHIEKITSGTYRLGITYANLKANEGKITGPMNGGTWDLDLENYIITNKNGEKKLRVYTAVNKKSNSKWYLNGKETTKEFLIENGYLSVASQNHSHIECFDIFVKNILMVGSEAN